MQTEIILFISSIAISAFGNIVGIGGGALIVPLLVLLDVLPINMAIGTATIALLASSITGSIINYKNKSIRIKEGIIFEVPAVFGVILGAYLTSVLSIALLQKVFAVYLVWNGLRIIRNSAGRWISKIIKMTNSVGPFIDDKKQISLLLLTLTGSFAGVISGLFGIGGGVVKTPVLIKVFKFDIKQAVSTSIFMIIITSAFAALSHSYLGNVNVRVGIPIVLGFVLGAIVGAKMKEKISPNKILKLLGVTMIAVGASLLIQI